MKKQLLTKAQILKKYADKFIDVYPHHHTYRNSVTHNFETVYEVRGVSKTIKENFQSPEEATS